MNGGPKADQQANTKKLPPVYSRQYKAEMVAKHQSSGLTQSQFCRENGLVLTTFNNWIHRLKKTDKAVCEANIGKFVDVKVAESAMTQPRLSEELNRTQAKPAFYSIPQPSPPADLQIQLPSNCVIIVPRGFDDETLRRVVKVVS